MVTTSAIYRTLLDRDITVLEQKLAALDALYARRRAELVERIERLEKIREQNREGEVSKILTLAQLDEIEKRILHKYSCSTNREEVSLLINALREAWIALSAYDPPMPESYESELTFRQLQTEQHAWVQHNFPGRESYHSLLGAVEEMSELIEADPDNVELLKLASKMGRLAHHHLKRIQGVRGTAAEHHEKAQDAIADMIIFLSDYCTANGYALQEIIEMTWGEVKQRDWRKDPEKGGSESVPCWE